MRSIKYVGLKSRYTDVHFGTGLVFEPGQVHMVPPASASKMKLHPTVFQDVTGSSEGLQSEQPPTGNVEGEDGKAPQDPANPPQNPVTPPLLPAVEAMNRDALLDYALTKFNVKLPGNIAEDKARERVVALINSGGQQ